LGEDTAILDIRILTNGFAIISAQLRKTGFFYRYRQLKIILATLAVKKSFAYFGRNSTVHPACRIEGADRIWVGDNVHIRSGCWIQTYDEGEITIGDGTLIGYHCKLTARSSITIGKDVLFADNIYITDFDHEYKDMSSPIRFQPLTHGKPVVIEDQAWIGQNVVIRPGVVVGRHSVIGSSAVVTRSVPSCSVVAGIPARVVQKYSDKENAWVKVHD